MSAQQANGLLAEALRAPGGSSEPLPESIRQEISVASMTASVGAAQQSLAAVHKLLEQMSGGAHTKVDLVSTEAIRTVPRWHFAMVNDFDRNDAFAVALERVVPHGAQVLDIGSGTGLLAMMAIRAGAASVTTCEANPMLAELARLIIARHGMSDVITVVPKMSTDLVVGVDLPRRADLIVSEIVDCGLIGEGVLPTLRDARERLLAPGGRLLPESGTVLGALVDSAAVDKLNRVHTAAGFDVALLNEVATRGHFPVRLPTWPHRMLSEPRELASFDFARDPLVDGYVDVDVPVSASGETHALVAWFELNLGAGVVLRNSPDNLASHWMQACIPFAEPVPLEVGESAGIRFSWSAGSLSARHLAMFEKSEETQ